MKNFKTIVFFGVLLLLYIIPLQADTNITPEQKAAWKTISNDTSGYIIWESSRTGSWRIWRRNLDGSNLRQISPEESGRDHYCPHISPNGERIIYISYPNGKNSYDSQSEKDDNYMHIMNSEGKYDRILVKARAYGEDRAAVWIDNDNFIFIDNDGYTSEFNISSGESKILSKETKSGFGWLININRTFAVPGWPASFNPFDASTGKITPARELGGCQPYFSRDCKWGYWMGRGGGPINKYNLATGEISPILGRNDPRMPAERNYLYFPMLSSNQKLIVFGASPNQHDHFNSDYDIFAAKINPDTLEIIGSPVRYSFDPACDRFPDAYVEDLELGEYAGEAPFSVKIVSPKITSEDWEWDYGDGSFGKGVSASHTYSKPGQYLVKAKKNDVTLRGNVTVNPRRPPRMISASLEGNNRILLMFDEPVDISKAKFGLASKNKIIKKSLADGNKSVVIQLESEVKQNDTIFIKQIRDAAQAPNTMPDTSAEIKTHKWPFNDNGLLFNWSGKNGVYTNLPELFSINADGKAAYDNNYSMITKGGLFIAPELGDYLTTSITKTNQLTIELVIRTDSINQEGPARILTLSSSPRSRNFTIGQSNNRIVLRLRTPQTGLNGSNPEIDLCSIDAGKPLHLIVAYSPGKLACYADGKTVVNTNSIQGDFSNWGTQEFAIGNELTKDRTWHGAVDGISIYNRAMSAEEALLNYNSFISLNPIKTIPSLEVTAKLIKTSKTPTLDEIKPYREGLVLYEYEIEKIAQGNIKSKKIRVAHWAILGGENILRKDLKNGSSVNMFIQPFELNPQLESIYMSDSLEIDPDIPIYYDVDF